VIAHLVAVVAAYAHPEVYRHGVSLLVDAYNVWFLLKLRERGLFTL